MRHRSTMLTALALSAMAATVAGAGVAAAQVYPPGSCGLALSGDVAVPGESIVAATAECDSAFAAGATVTFTLRFAGDGGGAGGGGGGTGGGSGPGNPGNPGGPGNPGNPGGPGNPGNPGGPGGSQGQVIGETTADGEGNVSAPIAIPAGVGPGAYTLVAAGTGADGSTVTLAADVTATTDTGAESAGRSGRSGGSAERASATDTLSSEEFTPLWIVAPGFVALTLGASTVMGLRRRALLRARI
jgi:hypothetical protein